VAFQAALPGYDPYLYDSGTSALALAIAAARSAHGSTSPEVILPAYCCPDIVASSLYAGVRPRLVDTVADGWGYDPQGLQAALNANTVAVVAVNLLGVGDGAAELAAATRANGSFLIQDSAQYLPTPPEAEWSGDYVVLSFGRGKPLNLLRGGALAVRQGHAAPVAVGAELGFRGQLSARALGSRAAALAFNLVTHPRAYWLTSRFPGLGLGGTHFHALQAVTQMPPSTWGQVGAAYAAYAREAWRLPWEALLPDWNRLGLRPLACGQVPIPAHIRRLRFALLAESRNQRDAIVRELDRHGLGASVMYDLPMNRISEIPAQIAQLPAFSNAEALAGRLFTLPTHSAVTEDVLARTDACIRSLLAGGCRSTAAHCGRASTS
jgi:hypothetical protein